MVIIFIILGVICFLAGIIIGIVEGMLLLGLMSGVFSGSIFIGIASLLYGQEMTRDLIRNSFSIISKPVVEEIVCIKCGKTYGDDRKSCPYCGFKVE